MTAHYGCDVISGKHVAVRLDDAARVSVPVGEPRKTPREAIDDVLELRRIAALPVQMSWEEA
jgi:hypothetical protein